MVVDQPAGALAPAGWLAGGTPPVLVPVPCLQSRELNSWPGMAGSELALRAYIGGTRAHTGRRCCLGSGNEHTPRVSCSCIPYPKQCTLTANSTARPCLPPRPLLQQQCLLQPLLQSVPCEPRRLPAQPGERSFEGWQGGGGSLEVGWGNAGGTVGGWASCRNSVMHPHIGNDL